MSKNGLIPSTENERALDQAKERAENWLRTHLDGKGLPRTLRNIEQALLHYAPQVRGTTWRTVRSGLARHQEAEGYGDTAKRLRQVKNPVPLDQRKPKPRRCKSVDDATMYQLLEAVYEKDDWSLRAVLHLAIITGCRPAEMRRVKAQRAARGWEVRIPGAKRRTDRGIDERILFVNEDAGTLVAHAADWLQYLDDKQFKAIQERLRKLVNKLFPRRNLLPSLYSFRHQFAAHLKACADMTDEQVAAAMGHKSVDSVSVYGGRRQGKGGRGIGVSAKTVAKVMPGLRLRRPLDGIRDTGIRT